MSEKLSKGMTITAVFLLLTGCNSLLNILYLSNKIPLLSEFSSHIETSIAVTLSLLFLGLTAFISGFGLLLKQKWGWYLGCFYIVYGLLRHLSVLVHELLSAGKIVPSSMSLLFFILLCSLLFNSKRSSIFQIEKIQKVKAVCISGAVSALLWIITAAIFG